MADSKPFALIVTRTPPDVIDLVDADAKRLGISRADWIRASVHRQLTVHKMTKTEAARYRRPNTREGQREYARGWS